MRPFLLFRSSPCLPRAWSRGALRTLFTLCTLLSALFLASCYSYSHDVYLNKDGSGTMKIYIEHEQVSYSLKQSPKIEQREKQDCDEPALDWGQIEGVEIQSCQNWIEDYRVFEESIFSFNDVSLLSTEEWSFRWQREGSDKVFTMSYDTGESAPTKDDQIGAREEMAGFRGVRFSVTLPKNISDAPGALVKGNTATWDYTWDEIIDEGMTELHMVAKVKLNLLQRIFGW
jgi:hypothetical protein